MPKMTPEQEAAYALDYQLPREDLKPTVQAAYDNLLAQRADAGLPVATPVPSPPVARPDGYAAASLVLGLIWLGGIGSVLALIFGALSHRQARSDGMQTSGMAGAGMILGGIGVILLVIVIAVRAAGTG